MVGTSVAASPQIGVGNQTDVFAIKNGQLNVFWVDGGGAWKGPVGLGPAGAFPPGAALAASPQYGVPNQTDVFAVGNSRLAAVRGAQPDRRVRREQKRPAERVLG
jgi:hypothetical protein